MSKDFKVDFLLWDERYDTQDISMTFYDALQGVETSIQDIDDLLIENDMQDTGYVSQEEDIETVVVCVGDFNSYISTLQSEIETVIDDPLYKGFQNKATEDLSRVKLEDYSTDNKIRVQEKITINDSVGQYTSNVEKNQLGFADFWALRNYRQKTNMPTLLSRQLFRMNLKILQICLRQTMKM